MRKRRQRVRQASKPSHFWERLPWFLIMLTWWGAFTVMVTRIDPERLRNVGVRGAYVPFFAVLFLTLISTIAVVGKSWWRGVIWSGVVCVFGFLRLLSLGYWLNALLLIGLAGSVEYYCWSIRPPMFPVDKT